MNWLTDISHNKKSKIITPLSHPLYFSIEGQRKIKKMRTYIDDNSNNIIKIEEGYKLFADEIIDYKKLLHQKGIHIVSNIIDPEE